MTFIVPNSKWSNGAEPAPSQTVSASDLVRNFGTWQDRAISEPVFILKRGRPRLVMMATELIAQLNAARTTTDPWPAERAAVLDAVREVVILLDSQLKLELLNSTARDYFGSDANNITGLDLARIVPSPLGDFLIDLARRTQASGIREHVEVAMGSHSSRHLSIVALPLRGGVALVGQDVTVQAELDDANGALSAVDDALAVLDHVAKVRINLRGYLVRPTTSFARLTQLSVDALATIRFVSLIEIGSRVAIGDAIERVLETRKPLRADGKLLVNGSRLRPISIGFSPLTRGMAVEGVQAILLADPASVPSEQSAVS